MPLAVAELIPGRWIIGGVELPRTVIYAEDHLAVDHLNSHEVALRPHAADWQNDARQGAWPHLKLDIQVKTHLIFINWNQGQIKYSSIKNEDKWIIFINWKEVGIEYSSTENEDK